VAGEKVKNLLPPALAGGLKETKKIGL